jgi:hypothetical protein
LEEDLIFMHWAITNEFILSGLAIYALGYQKWIYSCSLRPQNNAIMGSMTFKLTQVWPSL